MGSIAARISVRIDWQMARPILCSQDFGGNILSLVSVEPRHGYTDKARVERGIEPPVLSYILQRPVLLSYILQRQARVIKKADSKISLFRAHKPKLGSNFG
jgi:hypothetical protein